MRSLNRIKSPIGLVVAIAAFSMATPAFTKQRSKLKRHTPVQVQSACIPNDGRTTVIARPFGSEGDRYVCVGECRVVRMCLLEYCYYETVCDPCARVVVVIGN